MLEFSDKTIDLISYKELWAKNDRPTVMYLHNPFCKTEVNCGYCMHKGCPKNNHTEQEVQQFYFEYMPKLLKDFYGDIIEQQEITLMNFGGGTPNYLSATDFEKYMSIICSIHPKLLNVSKVIELHPALITKEFIDVLHKFNFTTLIFCFQTFNNAILIKQGRLVPKLNNAFSCYNYARSLGMNLAIDLITYWDIAPGWENTLREDLVQVAPLKPDELTISVLYQNKYGNDKFNGADVYRKITRELLHNPVFKDYDNPEGTLEDFYNVAATRIYNPNSNIRKDFDIYINSLTDMSWEHEQGYSTLGIGTYKNGDKAAYSIIGPDILVYEEDNGLDKMPILHLHRNYNFWDAARNIIDFLQSKLGDNPPVGANLVLQNICTSQNLEKEQFAQFIQGNCRWDFSPRVCFSGKSTSEVLRELEFKACIDNIDKNESNCYNIGERRKR